MDAVELRRKVLLTLQVALLGMVTPGMRSVLVSWSESQIRARIIFDEEPTPDDIEDTSVIEAEVMASFPDHAVVFVAERCPVGKKVEHLNGEAFVFARADPK